MNDQSEKPNWDHSNDYKSQKPPKKEGNGHSSGPKNIKSVQKIVFSILAVLILLLLAFNSIYTLKEQEQAVVTTFGVPEQVIESGMHFKIPFIQQVQKVSTTTRGFSIGYDEATGESIDDESLMITSDYNFVNVDFYIEYRVADPIKYVYSSRAPETILKTLSQSYIRDTIGTYSVDDVITTGKNEIQSVVKDELIARLDKEDIGLQLVNVTIQDAEPPTAEVLQAFKAVENAKQGKETAVNNANKYKNEKEPEAEATIYQISQEAQATKQSRINEAEGQVARFEAMFEEYKKYPLVTKQRMFYETMEEILPDLKVIINSGDGSTQTIIPTDSLFGQTVKATPESSTEKTEEAQ